MKSKKSIKVVILLAVLLVMPVIGVAQEVKEKSSRAAQKKEMKDSVLLSKQVEVERQRITNILSNAYNGLAKQNNAPLLPKMKLDNCKSQQYLSQRQATISVMNSLLNSCSWDWRCEELFGTKFSKDDLFSFADLVCEKYKNDPILMDSISRAFFVYYHNLELCEERYEELKNIHPNYLNAYYSLASIYHSLAWEESNDEFIPRYLIKAKQQINYVKQISPNSPEPYMRWIAMQGKYDPQSVSLELDSLYGKISDYPAYLETARMFDDLSNEERSNLLYAREYYSKAERDVMKAEDYNNYSLVCYRLGMVQRLQDNFREGIDVANKGLEIEPNKTSLLRMKLWNQAGMTTSLTTSSRLTSETMTRQRISLEERKRMWNKAYDLANMYIKRIDAKFDVIDYRWMANAYMEKGDYNSAIDLFKRQIGLEKDSKQHAQALFSIADCYRKIGAYDAAIWAFERFEIYKKLKAKEDLEAYHYQLLRNVYLDLAMDTLATDQKRIENYEKSDSVLTIMGKVSPEYLGLVNNQRLDIAFYTANLKYTNEGDTSNVYIGSPLILEAANRLVKTVREIKEEDRQVNDQYYMMRGIRYAMENYLYSNKIAEAWVCANEIMQMPSASELTGLSSARVQEYEQCMSRANQIYSQSSFAARGKRLKDSWHPFE